jgi:hypothetical protein
MNGELLGGEKKAGQASLPVHSIKRLLVARRLMHG